MREMALHNADGKLPDGYQDEDIPAPPQEDDVDIENVSMDFSAMAIDAEIGQELDESGIERVPMADPAIDLSNVSVGS